MDAGVKKGKKRDARRPGIDYSLFEWLRNGDYQWIAEHANVSVSMVGATIRGETFNPDVIEWGMKKACERMKPVLEAQAEAKRLLQLVNTNQ